LHEFIHNPKAVIDKDAYAKGLFEKMSGNLMTPQTLTDEQIDDVLAYVNTGGGGTPPPPPPPGGGEHFNDVPSEFSWSKILFWGILLLLIVAGWLANRLLRKKEGDKQYE